MEVLEQTADHYGVDVASFATKHSKQRSRDVAAWLARRLTVATLRELAEPFGLGHPDSVRGLLGRAEATMKQLAKLRKEVEQLRREIQYENGGTRATNRNKRVEDTDLRAERWGVWSDLELAKG